jgi:hypothetical protein
VLHKTGVRIRSTGDVFFASIVARLNETGETSMTSGENVKPDELFLLKKKAQRWNIKLPSEPIQFARGLANVPDDTYKADLELNRLYLQYGDNLVRYSLAALGALGLSLTEVLKAAAAEILVSVFIAAGLFLMAIGFSIAHRYYSSEAIFWQVRAQRNNQLAAAHPQLVADVDQAHRSYNLQLSGRLLAVSSLTFFGGAVLFAGAFVWQYLAPLVAEQSVLVQMLSMPAIMTCCFAAAYILFKYVCVNKSPFGL